MGKPDTSKDLKAGFEKQSEADEGPRRAAGAKLRSNWKSLAQGKEVQGDGRVIEEGLKKLSRRCGAGREKTPMHLMPLPARSSTMKIAG